MNPLFESYKKTASRSPLGFDLNTALQNLAAQIAPTGMTPEQIVRQKIQNREMTQEQFAWCAQIADQLTGRRRY
jgi:hypothetical protein